MNVTKLFNNTDKQRNDAGINGCVNLMPEFTLASHKASPKMEAKKEVVNDQPKTNPAIANNHDSIFGMLMVECVLGDVMGEFAAETLDMAGNMTGVERPEWASPVTLGNMIDAYDEFVQDRHAAQKQKQASAASFTLGHGGLMSGLFNMGGVGPSSSALIRDAAPSMPDPWMISAMGGLTNMAPRI